MLEKDCCDISFCFSLARKFPEKPWKGNIFTCDSISIHLFRISGFNCISELPSMLHAPTSSLKASINHVLPRSF